MERYSISFDTELREMISQGRGLMSVWRRLDRDRRIHMVPHRRCPECDWSYRTILPDLHLLLNDDHLWTGVPLLRPLFKAFAYGEYRFAYRYCPIGSHEERLTGHLISEMCSSLAVVSAHISDRAKELYGEEVQLDFAYEDLAAGRRETYTGADFGIILFVNLPGMPEPHIRCAAFQAKKVSGSGAASARIDIEQLRSLLSFAGKDGAYYCFYDCDASSCLSPLVASAQLIAHNIADCKWNEEPTEHLPATETKAVEALKLSRCSLAEYLVFSMAMRGEGHPASNLWEAASYLTHRRNEAPGEGGPPVQRMLVVTLGSTHQQDIGSIPELLGKIQ